MPEHMGDAGTRAMAWVGRIMLSLSPQAERGKKLEEFAGKRCPFFDRGQPLDVSIRRQMETFVDRDLEKVHIHHGYQTEEVSRRLGARAFSFKGRAFNPPQNLDTVTAEELPQTANRGSRPASAVLTRTHSDAGMVLPAPAENTPLTVNTRRREGQDQPSVQVSAGGLTETGLESIPDIDVGEVANRVYRLMQHELTLDRERITKLGG